MAATSPTPKLIPFPPTTATLPCHSLHFTSLHFLVCIKHTHSVFSFCSLFPGISSSFIISFSSSMATTSATCVKFGSSFKPSSAAPFLINGRNSHVKLVTVDWANRTFPSLRSSRFRVSCSAKPETVEKVCEIVRKQLALPAESVLTPESKFSALGADSLDTVEIVMGLEEEFGINVEEESSQNITTVQEAADMIDKLVQKKGGA